MKTRIAIAAAGLLAGCSTVSLNDAPAGSNVAPKAQRRDAASASAPAPSYSTGSMSLNRYKQTVAQQVERVNPGKVYPGNPQAMLRSVVVIKYVLDSNGKLVHTETLRSNGDTAAVATALAALRDSSPFPPPPGRLLSRGHLEVLETMLFNDDGRFQMRSIAEPQLDE